MEKLVKKLNENNESILYKKTLKNLPEMAFLSYQTKGLNFSYRKRKKNKDSTKLKQKLLKNFIKENTIIICNGEVIFNNTSCVNNNTLIKENVITKYDFLNKEHNNSVLNLQFKESKNQEVYVVISGNKDLYHYSNYELLENSCAKITEEFVLENNAKLNYKSNIKGSENALLDFYSLEVLKNKSANVFSYNIELLENATLNFYTFNLNFANILSEVIVSLLGENALGNINSFNFANKDNQSANLIKVTHKSKRTISNIENFGVVSDTAKLVIDGLNVIENGQAKSVAEQKTKIVNLSDTCKSSANPQLCINEYDVQASHSANVGKIDEEQLYYLMSRGLTKRESTELIITSYAEKMLENITDKVLEKRILKGIKNKLK